MHKKQIFYSLLIVIILSTMGSAALAGDWFERIVEGTIISDGGSSYSCSWVDVNGDGYLDLYVGNAVWNSGQNNFFYLNRQDGTFLKLGGLSITNDGGETYGHCWGDFDNDGDPDLYLTEFSGLNNKFYINNGDMTFDQITVGNHVTDAYRSNNATWIDFDNDGDLDLSVTNQGSPYSAPNSLYRNDNGTFTKITSGSIVIDAANTHGQAWADYDNDGDLDLFVANFIGPGGQNNCLYNNDGNGTFTKVTAGAIVNDGGTSLCPTWGDYDNDGDFDLYVANSYGAGVGLRNFLYDNNGDGTFTKVTIGPHVTDEFWSAAAAWVDLDNDGDLDLFETVYEQDHPERSYNLIYVNILESGEFERLSFNPLLGPEEPIIITPGMHWGFACGDYDRDGDLDIFECLANNGIEDNILWQNKTELRTPMLHWIDIKLTGVYSNRSAIGAKIRLKAKPNPNLDDYWQLRQITSAAGYMSQHTPNAHFGLGYAEVIDSLIVEWPSGLVDTLVDVEIDQHLEIVESCCVSARGNVNADPEEKVNISDLTYLVRYLFDILNGPEPPCMAEANVNGDPDGDVNISDVTYLVSFLFDIPNGPEPPACR